MAKKKAAKKAMRQSEGTATLSAGLAALSEDMVRVDLRPGKQPGVPTLEPPDLEPGEERGVPEVADVPTLDPPTADWNGADATPAADVEAATQSILEEPPAPPLEEVTTDLVSIEVPLRGEHDLGLAIVTVAMNRQQASTFRMIQDALHKSHALLANGKHYVGEDRSRVFLWLLDQIEAAR